MNWKEIHDELIQPVLILLGAILFWRGIWNLLDLHLFPKAPSLSAAISVFLGLDILLITKQLKKIV